MTAASLAAWRLAPNVGQAAGDWPDNYVVQALVRWDAGWYGTIATEGYWYQPGHQSPVAFFPLFPLAIRTVSLLGINAWLAGVALSALSGLGALLVLAKWARTLAPEDVARRAVWLIALYPFAFYLYGVMYSDSLFLLLTVGAFFCLERDRPGAATVLGALATAARPVAPALVLGLLARRIEWRLQRNERIQITDFLPLGAGLGFSLYAYYLGTAFGDPFAFVHVQGAPGWDQAPGPHTWLKLTMFETLPVHHSAGILWRYFAHTAVTFGLLALVPATYRRVGKAYGLYLLLVIGMPALSSKDFMGMGRYALAAFPAFLTLAHLLHSMPRLRRAWLVTSLALLLFLSVQFGATRYIS